MRRLSRLSLASGLAAGAWLVLPAVAEAAPPSLPAGQAEDADADGADAPGDDAMLTSDGQPMPTGTTAAGPGEDVTVADDSATDGSEGEAADPEVGDFDAQLEGEGSVEGGAEFDSGLDGASGNAELAGEAATDADVSMGSLGYEGESGPGMVAGRREPMMMSLRGPIGLYHTSLADVGGKYTVRFNINSDFFVANDFFCCEDSSDGDRNARIRGRVNLGFTFTEWTEVYFNINTSANRNTRNQGARQDPPTVFALGDMQFGVKGAYRFLDGGIGLGGQLGLGLISGSERLRTARVNFDFAVLLTADLRYLTEKEIPVRISGNFGWTLDNSPRLLDWGAISDPLSREVLRFASGVNHSRINTRLAVDFPIRLGKDKQFGLDPVIEYSWDIATFRQEDFVELTEEFGASPLQRSQGWLTLGLRANLYDGLFVDAAVDVGTTSPSYEFGPPVPPYQIIFGLGWSFDPKPRVKKVPVPVPDEASSQPVLEGRILGRVADLEGNPIADAKVSFPGLASNVLLTDSAGMFTSFRFPEGMVMISVELPDGSVVEQSADVRTGEDIEVDVVVDAEATAGDPVFDGTFLGADGEGLQVSVALDGEGIQESFDSDETGRIAIALPLGEYKATISAEGYAAKEISFTVTEAGAIVSETLSKGDGEAAPAGELVETPLIRGSKSRIRLRKGIRYSGNDLNVERSTEVLDQLATYLQQHPEYLKVQIRVHTDDRGNPNSRSKARAEAVVAYLVGKGIDASRLEAKGYGARDPVAVNITSEGRRKNNRTELRVRDYDESKKPAE